MTPFQTHIIGFPQMLCWFIKGYIWTCWSLWFFLYSQCCSLISPYQTQNNLDYLQIEIVKVKRQRKRNIVVPTFCALSKQNLSQFIQHCFGFVFITILKWMIRKVHMKGLPTNIPVLEEPYHIFLLAKATKIPRIPTIDV